MWTIRPQRELIPPDRRDCLATYSLLNFSGSIELLMHLNTRFPDSIIIPRTATGEGVIEYRSLLWGLYSGVSGMIFYDIWDNEVVGYIKIIKPDAQSTVAASNHRTVCQKSQVESWSSLIYQSPKPKRTSSMHPTHRSTRHPSSSRRFHRLRPSSQQNRHIHVRTRRAHLHR